LSKAGTPIARPLTMGFVALALVVTVFAATAKPAEAGSRIRAGSCDVYQNKVLDPIAKATHVHSFVGGMTINSNDVSGHDLLRMDRTSCKAEDNWATSGRWFPRAKGFVATEDTLYYRDPGDFNNLHDVPTDLRLLSSEVIFRGDSTNLGFPNCLAVKANWKPKLDSADHRSHAEEKGKRPCDSSHPYRIPDIAYLIHWPKKLTTSTPVSIGDNQWGPAGQYFHGDYLAGNQPEFNKKLIDRCLNNVRDSVDMAHSSCGVGP
jgi:hypothetical protein